MYSMNFNPEISIYCLGQRGSLLFSVLFIVFNCPQACFAGLMSKSNKPKFAEFINANEKQ